MSLDSINLTNNYFNWYIQLMWCLSGFINSIKVKLKAKANISQHVTDTPFIWSQVPKTTLPLRQLYQALLVKTYSL